MLILILLLVLTWVVLTLLLTAWSAYVQTYLYTEATPGLHWRGAAAAGAIMGVLLPWVMLDYVSPGNYRPLWEFSSSKDVKPFPELRIINTNGREEVYKLRPGSREEYRLDGLRSGRLLPTRPSEIIVVEGSEKVTFKPERDENGNFKQRTTTAFGRVSKEPLRYVDDKGRVMLETSLGQLSSFRAGVFLGNWFLNLLLAAVLFVGIWLLLGFQWPHALGQAFVLWLLLLLFVLPPLLTHAETVSRQRNPERGVENKRSVTEHHDVYSPRRRRS